MTRLQNSQFIGQACDTEARAVRDGYVGSRRVYDEAVKEALIVMWEASDRICGKRLKAILTSAIEATGRGFIIDIGQTFRKQGGNREKVAELPGIGRKTLYRKLKQYQIE